MLGFLTLVFFFLHSTLGVDVSQRNLYSGGIPNRRFNFGDAEYEISASKTDWYTARNFCALQGGQLLSIETQEENLAVLQALSGYTSESIWTSGSDIDKEKQFYWDSTGAAFENFTSWAPGKPGDTTYSENCVRLNATLSHLWSDANCDLEHFFICEFHPCSDRLERENVVAKEIKTPLLRFTFENGTYELSDDYLTWVDAKSACKLKGMELVSIETAEEHQAIVDAVVSLGRIIDFWTSGYNGGHFDSYYWEGSGLAVGPYTGWAPGEPTNPTVFNCIYLNYAYSHMWADGTCLGRFFYICELQPCQSQKAYT